MNQALVDRIVSAVLYEGYMLYPYRPSVKNRQRWTFGGVYPRAYSDAAAGNEPWFVRTECPVRGGAETTLDVRLRFLHLTARLVGELDAPRAQLADGEEPAFHVVERLQVGDRMLLSWQEAVEREHGFGELTLAALADGPRRSTFAFPASRQLEPVPGPSGEIVAVLVREQRPLAGAIEVSAALAAEDEGLFKLGVRVENLTPVDDGGLPCRDRALLCALVSAHSILGVRAGDFVSLVDPPAGARALASSCQNIGTWPVLVGECGETDTMLSSPIILYDYPRIAPESPGDLFDCTEIDEILSLRILTLAESEKQAAAAVDERVRALLHRTESLADQERRGLHGTMRGLRLVTEGGRS
jgi:hypothetical protein